MALYLVTGGAGFVGSHLAEHLLDRGHRVRVLDDLSTGSRSNVPGFAEFVEGDVTDEDTVERAFEGVDGCFHLAAVASVERCHHDWLAAHKVNLAGTITVFDQARRSSLRPVPVVYASSAAVYGDAGSSRVVEERPVAPLSAYGVDKAACEAHARIGGALHALPTVGLRFFNLYGPRQDARSPYSGVISIFSDRLRRGRAVDIYGDGEQVRDFTFVGDAVAALCRAMAMADTSAPIFNVCTGHGTTVRDLAEALAGLCGRRPVIRHLPPRRGEVRCSIGDPLRAAQRLGFRTRTPLLEGLALTLRAAVRPADSGALAVERRPRPLARQVLR